MSIKKLFGTAAASARGAALATDTTNAAGGKAYSGTPFYRLASIMSLSLLQNTFYARPEAQVAEILQLSQEVTPEELAKIVVYSRTKGLIRQASLIGLVVLSTRSPELFRRIFPIVVRNLKDLRDFAILVKSGHIRKGFGTAPRKAIGQMLSSADPYQFIKYGSDNQNMSIKDLIMLTHPKPTEGEREHLLRYTANITNRETKEPTWVEAQLPQKVRAMIEFKNLVGKPEGLPRRLELLKTGWLPHEAVTGCGQLTVEEWTELALSMPYMATLRNLNTMHRQGVFENKEATKAIAARLSNVEAIRNSGVFPMTIYNAYQNARATVPPQISEALAVAIDVICAGLSITGEGYVSVDVSGSMGMPVTPGGRGTGGYTVTAKDAAALIASTVIKGNEGNTVLTLFDDKIRPHTVLKQNSTLTTAAELAKIHGGATDVSLVLNDVLARGPKNFDFVVAVTDNESWVDGGYRGHATASQAALQQCLKINPNLKVVFVKAVYGSATEQLKEETPNLLLVSGFSDAVFQAMQSFLTGKIEKLEEIIRAIEI